MEEPIRDLSYTEEEVAVKRYLQSKINIAAGGVVISLLLRPVLNLILQSLGSGVVISAIKSAVIIVVCVLLPFCLMSRKLDVKLNSCTVRGTIGIDSFLIFTICLGAITALNIVFSLIGAGDSSPAGIGREAGVAGFAAAMISSALLPAVIEELVFRGMLISAFKKFGATFAVAVSSVLFACMHTTFKSGAYALVSGIILAYCALRCRGIIFSVIIHFAVNALSVAAAYYPVISTAMAILIIVAGAVCALIMLIKRRGARQSVFARSTVSISEMFKSPIVIFMFMVYLYFAVVSLFGA